MAMNAGARWLEFWDRPWRRQGAIGAVWRPEGLGTLVAAAAGVVRFAVVPLDDKVHGKMLMTCMGFQNEAVHMPFACIWQRVSSSDFDCTNDLAAWGVSQAS